MKQLLLVIVAVLDLVPFVSAAQLDATILSEEDVIEPSFQFLRIIYIEYPDGGEISEILRGKSQSISFDADNTTEGMKELVSLLNQNIKTSPSNAIITDAKIRYHAMLQGNEKSAVIEYKVQLIPTITNHILAKSFEKSTVDANWRGMSVDKPVLIQTEHGLFDINNPKSALDAMVPDVSEKLHGITILELPLMDASGIMELPLDKWHSLFDNTAIIPGAAEYKYTGKNVITHYSMGECSIDVGLCNDRQWVENITLDKKYTIRIIESRDDATIAIEGYVDSKHVNGIEAFDTSLRSTVTEKPDTGGFPATVMYGMAGIAAVAGATMFVISGRKIKRDKNGGQTGIDPALLTAYETSDSAGGYKTNRGESILDLSKARTPI